MSNAFGDFIKRARVKTRESLRDFCGKHGFDPGNYSKMERGLSAPPQREELLERYAQALGFQRNTDDWIEFFDLAAASHGQLPKDLMLEEEVIGKLPVLFRTLRGTKVCPSKLDDLIEMIRKGV
jgi:transcriptional regulator with XRE-family HTH domain